MSSPLRRSPSPSRMVRGGAGASVPVDILPDEEGGFPNPRPSHATHAGNRHIVWGGIEWSRSPLRVKTGFCSGEGRRITVPEVSGPSYVNTCDLMFRTTSQMSFVPHAVAPDHVANTRLCRSVASRPGQPGGAGRSSPLLPGDGSVTGSSRAPTFNLGRAQSPAWADLSSGPYRVSRTAALVPSSHSRPSPKVRSLQQEHAVTQDCWGN